MFADNPIVYWRLQKQFAFMQGVQCLSCDAVYYSDKHTCQCGKMAFKQIVFSGKGRLLSFTQVTVAPQAFAGMVPYYLGLIELVEGARLIAQLTDIVEGEIFVGMLVNAVFRKYYQAGDRGLIYYGVKFVRHKE